MLAEPVKPGDHIETESEESKAQAAKDLEDDAGSVSQSNTSLLKSQRRKMRLMSLMELLQEFSASKSYL